MPSRKSYSQRAQLSKPDDHKSPGRKAVTKAKRKSTRKTKLPTIGLIQTGHTSPKLSTLEKLPVEILQDIFLLSPNLSLPKASPILGKALSSEYLKTELVIKAFSSAPTILPPKNPYSDGRNYSRYIPDCYGQHIKSAALCQQIFSQKWLTYDFFKRCQRIYLLRVAESQLRILGRDSPEADQVEVLAALRQNLDRYLSVGGFALSKANEACYGKPGLLLGDGNYVWKRKGASTIAFALLANGSTLRIDVIRSGEWPSSVCHRVEQGGPYQDFSAMWYNGMKHQEISSLTQFPGNLAQCIVPEKLLHGPWLQEKGDFLTLLSANHVGMLYHSQNSIIGEIASTGLEDAIRENNVLAVSFLLGVGSCVASGICHHKPDDECSRTLIAKEAVKTPTAENGVYLTNSNSRIFVPKPPDPRGPWRQLNHSSGSWGSPVNLVKPTTDHLKIALLEMNGCNEYIVKALMGYFIHHHRINYHDQEIMDWAFSILNRPTPKQKHPSLVYPTWEKPISGAMFMDLLEEAQNQQTTREQGNKRRRERLAERRDYWRAMAMSA